MVCALLLVAGQSAHAESSAPGCFNQHVTEIFAGTPDCPAAQYVVITGWAATYGEQLLSTDPESGASVFAANSFGYQARTLVGTPQAAALFGIRLDVVASGQLAAPDGSLSYCYEQVAYGVGWTVPALAAGQALHRDIPADWQLATPAPINSLGETGTLGSCADGGWDAAVDAQTTGTGGSGGTSTGSGGTSTGGSFGSGGTAGPTAGGSGGAIDAGTAGASSLAGAGGATDLDAGLRGIDEKTKAGCALGGARGRPPSGLGVVLAGLLACLARRRRASRRKA